MQPINVFRETKIEPPQKKNKTGDTRKKSKTQKKQRKKLRGAGRAPPQAAQPFCVFFLWFLIFSWCLLCFVFFGGGYFGIVFVFLGAHPVSMRLPVTPRHGRRRGRGGIGKISNIDLCKVLGTYGFWDAHTKLGKKGLPPPPGSKSEMVCSSKNHKNI